MDANDGDIDTNSRIALVGTDSAIYNWRVGGYLGVHNGDANFDQSGSSDYEGVTVGLYANTGNDDWYGDIAVEWQGSDVEYDGGTAVGEDEQDSNVIGFALEGGKTLYRVEDNDVMVIGRYVYAHADT